ncbi:MAG: YciI family protein [Thermomicrobiales bacterium]
MNYLCLVYGQEQDGDACAAAHETRAVVDALAESGYSVAAYALSPSHEATTLRVTGDGIVLRDGPVVPAGAALRTVFLLQARDLNEAVRIVSWLPDAMTGEIEIRPIVLPAAPPAPACPTPPTPDVAATPADPAPIIAG